MIEISWLVRLSNISQTLHWLANFLSGWLATLLHFAAWTFHFGLSGISWGNYVNLGKKLGLSKWLKIRQYCVEFDVLKVNFELKYQKEKRTSINYMSSQRMGIMSVCLSSRLDPGGPETSPPPSCLWPMANGRNSMHIWKWQGCILSNCYLVIWPFSFFWGFDFFEMADGQRQLLKL